MREQFSQITEAVGTTSATLETIDARGRGWGHRTQTTTEPAAAVVGASFSRLLDLVLRARLGPAARAYMGSVHSIENLNVIAARTAALLVDLLDRTPAGWFGSASENIDGRGAWHAALTRAFREAGELLSDRFGADPTRWDWGACRPLTLQHALSESPILARLFNEGPFPFGGDANCPLQSGAVGLNPLRPATAAPALRIVARMTSPPQLSFTLAGDQRTEPRPRYSLLNDWRAGRLRPLPWERAAVEDAAAERLTLLPAGSPDDLDTLTPNGPG